MLNELLHPEGCRIFNLLFLPFIYLLILCLSARLIRIVVDVNLLFILRAGQPGGSTRNEEGGMRMRGKVTRVGCWMSFIVLFSSSLFSAYRLVFVE